MNHRNPDSANRFLQQSRWASLISDARDAQDLMMLLRPDTSFIQQMTDHELREFAYYLGFPPETLELTSATTPEDKRADIEILVKEAFERSAFEELQKHAAPLGIDETFSSQPLEDVTRLIQSIPALKDTTIHSVPVPLVDRDRNSRVYYEAQKEQFINFGSVILHAFAYQSVNDEMKLSCLTLYCNWKPHGELGEILVDRLWGPSDITKNEDGVYALHADITKGAILKIVLLLKTGVVLDAWHHEPKWNLLSISELHKTEDNPDMRKQLELQKLELLPDLVKDKIIYTSLQNPSE